jgi:hypothetical protein
MDVLEEGFIRSLFRTNGVLRRLVGRWMNVYQWEQLDRNVRLREVLRQLFHDSLRRLAMGALQIDSVHYFEIFAC